MNCEDFREWLREVTAFPTPRKIAAHLDTERRVLAGPLDPEETSPRRLHLRACGRCRDRVERALRYWGLLADFCADARPGSNLELRVSARLRKDAAAGVGPTLAPAPGVHRFAQSVPVPASAAEQDLYAEGDPSAVVGWLVPLNGEQAGHDVRLFPGENVIGSHEWCHICIDDPSVAPFHASIVCAVTHGGVSSYVLDLSGHGGLVVNRASYAVGWARLEDADVVGLGEVLVKFKTLVGLPVEAGAEAV